MDSGRLYLLSWRTRGVRIVWVHGGWWTGCAIRFWSPTPNQAPRSLHRFAINV